MSTMNELLLEIGCEELPGGFVDPALAFRIGARDGAEFKRGCHS